jgi:alpha-tubulin suppressor-like RCC1 family protein
MEPKLVDTLSKYDIIKASAGNKHSLVMTNCGKVFSWGKGDRDMRTGVTDFYEPRNPFDS